MSEHVLHGCVCSTLNVLKRNSLKRCVLSQTYLTLSCLKTVYKELFDCVCHVQHFEDMWGMCQCQPSPGCALSDRYLLCTLKARRGRFHIPIQTLDHQFVACVHGGWANRSLYPNQIPTLNKVSFAEYAYVNSVCNSRACHWFTHSPSMRHLDGPFNHPTIHAHIILLKHYSTFLHKYLSHNSNKLLTATTEDGQEVCTAGGMQLSRVGIM